VSYRKVNTFCGADYTTRVLTDYVDDEFTFEQAFRRLAAVPAITIGLWGRGHIAPGAAVDLVSLDRSTLAVGPARLLRDFPAGAARLVWEQRGYKATIVNGDVLIDDGVATGSTPGTVLRFNQ
jgi:N-acyl-D-aspartate/D-glutamate deacylase